MSKGPVVGHTGVGVFAVVHHAGQTFRTAVSKLELVGRKWSNSHDQVVWGAAPQAGIPGPGPSQPLPPQQQYNPMPAGNRVRLPVYRPECPVDVGVYELRRVVNGAGDSTQGPLPGLRAYPGSPRAEAGTAEYFLPVLIGQHSISLVRDDYFKDPMEAGKRHGDPVLRRRSSANGRQMSQIINETLRARVETPRTLSTDNFSHVREVSEADRVDAEDGSELLWQGDKLQFASLRQISCDLVSPALDRPPIHGTPASVQLSLHHFKSFPDSDAPSSQESARNSQIKPAALSKLDLLEYDTIVRGDTLFRRVVKLEVAPCKLLLWGNFGVHLAVLSTTQLRMLSGTRCPWARRAVFETELNAMLSRALVCRFPRGWRESQAR